jgi:hypothetical protein
MSADTVVHLTSYMVVLPRLTTTGAPTWESRPVPGSTVSAEISLLKHWGRSTTGRSHPTREGGTASPTRGAHLGAKPQLF